MRMSDWSSDVCSSDLFSEIGEGDGLRITTNTRFNFGSGKGAIDADISYPIDRLIGGNLNFYLIGQAFTGYGENLLDYNRRMTRLRLGLAIVRRAEEHTSELQSLMSISYAVFCLKKKTYRIRKC